MGAVCSGTDHLVGPLHGAVTGHAVTGHTVSHAAAMDCLTDGDLTWHVTLTV